MKKLFLRLLAFLVALTLLVGAAATEGTTDPETQEPPDFTGAFYNPEGYYNSAGEYVAAGYYFPDGTFISKEEAEKWLNQDKEEDPPEGGDPVDPEDPGDPGDPDDPTVPDIPEIPEIPDVPPVEGQPQLNPELSRYIVRIGLRYGSSAMDGANLGNSVGSGFRFGYYDSNNQFVSVGYTTRTTISVVKTENVYYGSYNGYATYYDHLTNSNIGVGCYHLQTGGSYSNFEAAHNAASQYDGGFVAYVNGTYYVRIGNYLTRDAAVAAQNSYAASGVSTELKGTSSYGVSVVIKGTNTIIFQFDDNGRGTGLGVEPMPASNGQKCVSVFAGVEYYGGFRYERINGGNLTIVNMIAVDDYIKGVVCNEMSPNWHIEALKSQAVAARSYALHNLNSHKSYHFDACPTTCCQSYGGLENAASSTDLAVDSTMGIVVRYDGKVANAVFYSSNGGASESSATVWGSSQSKYPYLIGIEDPHEATVSIPGYEWTRTYSGAELAKMIRSVGYTQCSTVVSVKIAEYTASGNPAWVHFTDDMGRVYQLNAKQANKALPLRSWRYEFVNTTELDLSINGETPVDTLTGLYALDENGNLVLVQEHAYIMTDNGVISSDGSGPVTGDTFTIVGWGWGHNVGMSQYGAQAMAKLGYTYVDILKFYYTGITVG